MNQTTELLTELDDFAKAFTAFDARIELLEHTIFDLIKKIAEIANYVYK